MKDNILLLTSLLCVSGVFYTLMKNRFGIMHQPNITSEVGDRRRPYAEDEYGLDDK